VRGYWHEGERWVQLPDPPDKPEEPDDEADDDK
jgi:hypothetical protein